MKNESKSRREFLLTSVKSSLLVGAGVGVLGSLLKPFTAKAQTGGADAQHRAKIGALGATSLQASKLALTKAANPKVKMFAKFEAAEQEAMGQILKDAGTVPAPDAAGKEDIITLQKLSGAAFDKAFMTAQVKTHQKLNIAVTAYQASTGSPQIKHFANLALSTIKEHTERGQMLLSELA